MDRHIIESFYRRYPYPQVDRVDWDDHIHEHLRYLARACRPSRPQGPLRMLIAGCGTREAVLWGASMPWAEIDAVDLSESSLEISKVLIDQLGVSNVRLIKGDFERGEGLSGPYDFISSFGVLHHLECPEEGLRQLEAHLAPDGLMALMLYSDMNRGPLQRAQKIINKLCSDPDPDRYSERAVDLVKTGAQVTNRLAHVFQMGVHDYEQNRPHFADTLLNPREVSYTIPSLVQFLKTAGLGIVAPVKPVAWDPEHVLPRQAYQRWCALPLLERLEISDSLLGTLFWVLVRREDEISEARPCQVDASLFWEMVPQPMSTGAWSVQNLVVGEPISFAPVLNRLGGEIVSICRDPKHMLNFHQIAWRMVKGFDGRRTLREIAAQAAREEGTELEMVEDTLKMYLTRLIDHMAIGTPDTTQYHRCPLNQ